MNQRSQTTHPRDTRAVDEIAAEWFVRRDDGLSEAEAREFADWCEADRAHAAAMARVEQTHRALTKLEQLPAHDSLRDEADALMQRLPGSRHRHAWRNWMAVGAAAAIALAAIGWWAWSRDNGAQTFTRTATGSERVTLPDGSAVVVNGSSQFRVQFSAAERRVDLERGEAHFTVMKNSARPFYVSAGGVVVRAVGTAFNVRLGEAGVEVLVTEGKVQLTREAARQEKTNIEQTTAPMFLIAGEQTVFALGNSTGAPREIVKLEAEAIREKLAWQIPQLAFSNTPLADVITEFNRHNALQLVLGDPELGTRLVGGSFRADNVETFVTLLEAGGNIRTERPDPEHIVLHAAKR